MASEVGKATQNFFLKYGKEATQNDIIGRLLKFNKFGEYRAGQDEDQIKSGTVLAAYMPSFCIGYQRWEDNRRVEAIMGPIGEGFVPPRRGDLGHTDQSKWQTFDDGRPKDPWQLTNTVVFVAPETLDLYTYSTASKGGIGALALLCRSHGVHVRQFPHEVPLVALDVSSYQHPNREYGEVRYPVFRVTGWVDIGKLPPIDGVMASAGNGSGGPAQLALDEPPSQETAVNPAPVKEKAKVRL
jgi:hypothetical protein